LFSKPLAQCSVRTVFCDRKISLINCEDLVKVVSDIPFFEAVVDFSAYDTFAVEECLKLLGRKCTFYIFISTDSIYEVCMRKGHGGRSLETDAIRPVSRQEQKILNRLDRYGHRKLKCEELLHLQSLQSDSVPYVVFRLADVIGARDCTNRVWQYILWIMLCLHHNVPIYVPENSRNQHISLCYVVDVASFVANLCSTQSDDFSRTDNKNACFNLASGEPLTTEQMLETIRGELNLTGQLIVHYVDRDDFEPILPSVTRGPVNVTKAMQVLNWNPLPAKEALKATVSFYCSIMTSSELSSEKEECLSELLCDLKDLYPEHLWGTFKKTLKRFLCLKK